MSKALFRYMRGELNGFYLQNIQNLMNVFSKDVKDFFYDFKKQQLADGEISDETVNNLSKFAGIYLLRLTRAEALSAIKMSDSFIYNEEEISERGLFSLDTETFNFDAGKTLSEGDDINSFATQTMRSSLVGDEEPIGYIDYTTQDVIDEEGNVRETAVLANPPTSGAYSEYYGNKFMFLSEGESAFARIEPSLLLNLFKAMQWVRYNGVSLTSLCRIIDILCPKGLIKIQSVSTRAQGSRFYINYVYNEDADIDMKQQRLYLLLYVVKLKFVQVEFIESE